MRQERPHPLRGLRRNWFTVVVAAFAVALGLGQLWFHRAVNPGRVATALVAAGSLAALAAFVVLVTVMSSRVRRLFRDLRYRWATRAVDRAMRRRPRSANRPAA